MVLLSYINRPCTQNIVYSVFLYTKTPHQTPHHRGREGASHPLDPTPQGRKEGTEDPHTTGGGGRGSPTHNTPHHRGRRREWDSHPQRPHTTRGRRASQSTPPQPAPQKGGLPRPFGGVGGAAERVTIYRHVFMHVYIYVIYVFTALSLSLSLSIYIYIFFYRQDPD